MNECPRCHRFRFRAGDCNCARFEAGIPWNGEVEEGGWTSLYATDAEDAAEKYAERHDSDSAEYTIVRNGEAEVWVRDEDNNVTKWDITAESVPTYSAHEKR